MTLRHSVAALCILASALSAAGQESTVRDYRFWLETQPFLALSNPALIDAIEGRTAVVEAFFQKEDGALVSLSGSANALQLGGLTESYFRVSDKLAFYGKMGWTYFNGKDMGGQILMEPDYNPVNFLESTLDTRGRKHRERYTLQGAMAYHLGPRWAAGVQVNYVSADQAKIKDPRFYNVWMDIDVKAGVTFRSSGRLALGASLQYRNTLEQIRGGIYGTTDQQYFIQTDKGAFLGTTAELSGDYNYIPVTENRPMNNHFLGGAVQAVLDGRWAQELSFLSRRGHYGRNASSSAIYFEWSGIEARYKSALVLPNGDRQQNLGLEACLTSLTNMENQFQYSTPTGQNTIVEYTGQDVVLRQTLLEASLEYAWHKGVGPLGPLFSLGTSLNGSWKNRRTTLYPLYRSQRLGKVEAEAFVRKVFPMGKARFSVEFRALAGGGFGVAREDGTEVELQSTSIKSFDTYLDRDWEYRTAARAGGQLGVGLRYPLGSKVLLDVRVQERYLSLLHSPQYLDGRGRNSALLSIGCSF